MIAQLDFSHALNMLLLGKATCPIGKYKSQHGRRCKLFGQCHLVENCKPCAHPWTMFALKCFKFWAFNRLLMLQHYDLYLVDISLGRISCFQSTIGMWNRKQNNSLYCSSQRGNNQEIGNLDLIRQYLAIPHSIPSHFIHLPTVTSVQLSHCQTSQVPFVQWNRKLHRLPRWKWNMHSFFAFNFSLRSPIRRFVFQPTGLRVDWGCKDELFLWNSKCLAACPQKSYPDEAVD